MIVYHFLRTAARDWSRLHDMLFQNKLNRWIPSIQIAFLEEKVLTEDNEKHKLVEQNQKLETQCSQMDAIHQVIRCWRNNMDKTTHK